MYACSDLPASKLKAAGTMPLQPGQINLHSNIFPNSRQ